MNWDFSQLLTFYYYFDKNPGGDFSIGYALLVFFVFLILLPFFVKNLSLKNKYLKKSMKKRFGKFIFFGVGGIILVASRFVMVPGFSMRIWLYLVFVGAIVFLFITFFQIFLNYKKRLKSVKREKNKQKNW